MIDQIIPAWGRIMSIESENIKDENYAVALFSAMGTLVSFIVALIALVSNYM